MNKLKFLNPTGIKAEVFSTVRLGTKWAERTAPEEGQQVVGVELADGEGKALGNAVVIGCWTGPLVQVPAFLLECSHDPVCRTWSGVAQTLAGIYKDPSVGHDTIITVLQCSYRGSVIETPKLFIP